MRIFDKVEISSRPPQKQSRKPWNPNKSNNRFGRSSFKGIKLETTNQVHVLKMIQTGTQTVQQQQYQLMSCLQLRANLSHTLQQRRTFLRLHDIGHHMITYYNIYQLQIIAIY